MLANWSANQSAGPRSTGPNESLRGYFHRHTNNRVLTESALARRAVKYLLAWPAVHNDMIFTRIFKISGYISSYQHVASRISLAIACITSLINIIDIRSYYCLSLLQGLIRPVMEYLDPPA